MTSKFYNKSHDKIQIYEFYDIFRHSAQSSLLLPFC